MEVKELDLVVSADTEFERRGGRRRTVADAQPLVWGQSG